MVSVNRPGAGQGAPSGPLRNWVIRSISSAQVCVGELERRSLRSPKRYGGLLASTVDWLLMWPISATTTTCSELA